MATQENSVLIGKMRQFAEECLRRHAINPEYSNEIMHTADTYRDLLKLCDVALAAGNEALEKAARLAETYCYDRAFEPDHLSSDIRKLKGEA